MIWEEEWRVFENFFYKLELLGRTLFFARDICHSILDMFCLTTSKNYAENDENTQY